MYFEIIIKNYTLECGIILDERAPFASYTDEWGTHHAFGQEI